ncbi:putative HET-domain-containing protein [Seiridium unicorne]|uniref:HET-domain-containing protein n=1 Tax=Seiridium unicorne TaxID=138068 RepID=A0ABR2V140_9PEZI
MDAYKYSPLPTEGFIRLLSLEPGVFDDDIILSLSMVPLQDLSPPHYEALSYVWGTSENPGLIHLRHEGCAHGAHLITKNLDTALRHLRFCDKTRVIWIDALCINQEDNAEKGVCVAMMGRIYRLAAQVIVWLGPNDQSENSDIAMSLMNYIGSQITMNFSTYAMKPVLDAVDISLGDRSKQLAIPKNDMLSIYLLLCRPYFDRLWIRQEIFLALSERVIVMCGYHEIPWVSFRTAMTAIFMKPLQPELPLDFRRDFRSRLGVIGGMIFQRAHVSLINLRRYFNEASCSDPRDRIFAVLDLLVDREKNLDIRPDYIHPKAQVYKNVVLQHMRYFGGCDIIRECQYDDKVHEPSWVPDWSRKSDVLDLIRSTLASSQIFATSRIIGDQILQVAGVEVAKLERTSAQLPGALMNWDNPEVLINTLRDIINNDMNLQDQYRCGGTLGEAWAAALIANGYDTIESPKNLGRPTRQQGELFIANLASKQFSVDHKLIDDLYVRTVIEYTSSRRVFCGTGGLVGICPGVAELGDWVCILIGCRSPMILRPAIGKGLTFKVIGECYVHGYSYGEALLGPLPPGVLPVFSRTDSSWKFTECDTGKLLLHDPRLEALGLLDIDSAQRLKDETEVRYKVEPDLIEKRGVPVLNLCIS